MNTKRRMFWAREDWYKIYKEIIKKKGYTEEEMNDPDMGLEYEVAQEADKIFIYRYGRERFDLI